MRYKFLILAVTAALFVGCSMEKEEAVTSSPTRDPEGAAFNEKLAAQLGADEYGMKKYVLAFLKAGPNRDQDSLAAANLQRAHLQNIGRLAEQGKLVLAGPFLDDGDLRGIYIFNVETVEEAKRLTETDPAIQTGRLVMELHPWYGSASLQQVNVLHKSVARKDP